MMKKQIIFLMVFSFTLFSCTEDKKEVSEVEKPKVEEKKIETPVYKGIPTDIANSIYSQADVLEGTFYESGKSVSLWDDNVKNIITMMLEPAPTSLDSKLVGHIMFLQQGQSLAFVEIYLSPKNNFVKYKINEEVYYNTLNAQGVKFLGEMATSIPVVKE